MFNIGFSEIIVILIAALIFIKPQHLPGFLRSIGKFYGLIRQYSNSFRWNLEKSNYESNKKQHEEKDDIKNQ